MMTIATIRASIGLFLVFFTVDMCVHGICPKQQRKGSSLSREEPGLSSCWESRSSVSRIQLRSTPLEERSESSLRSWHGVSPDFFASNRPETDLQSFIALLASQQIVLQLH